MYNTKSYFSNSITAKTCYEQLAQRSFAPFSGGESKKNLYIAIKEWVRNWSDILQVQNLAEGLDRI